MRLHTRRLNLLRNPILGIIISIPNLLPAAVIIHEPKASARAVPARRIHVMLGPAAVGLFGRAHGRVVPAGVQMVRHTVLAHLSAPVPDEEEAAGAHGDQDDDEAQDWEGDHHAQVYFGLCAWCREGHAGGEEGLGEDSGWGDVEGGPGGCLEVAVVSDGFEDWFGLVS